VKYCRSSVAPPAAVGVDIEVPLSVFVRQLLVKWLESPEAETTDTPGATMSGFRRPSEVGPREENDAIVLEPTEPLLVAPTARQSFAVAGALHVPVVR